MAIQDVNFGLDILKTLQLDVGEASDGLTGDYATEFQGYILRAYWEILKKERWPWAMSDVPGTIVTAASVNATANSISSADPAVMTLSATHATTLKGYKVYLDATQAIYRVASHTAGTDSVTLDSEFVEDTTSGPVTFYKDEYAVASKDVMKIWDPLAIRGQWGGDVPLYSKTDFEDQYGRSWSPGPAPIEAATEIHWDFASADGVRQLRFAPWSEDKMVLEYDYTKFHTLDFSGAGAVDTPKIPRESRQVLVFLSSYYAFVLKDDTKADQAFLNYTRFIGDMKDQYIPAGRPQFFVRSRYSLTLGL